jgi:hypothetical protein
MNSQPKQNVIPLLNRSVRHAVTDSPKDKIHFAVLKKIDGKYKFQQFLSYENFEAWHSPRKELETNAGVIKYNIVNEITMWMHAPPMIGSRYELSMMNTPTIAERFGGTHTQDATFMFICLRVADENWAAFFKETEKVSSVKYGSLIGCGSCTGNCSSCSK